MNTRSIAIALAFSGAVMLVASVPTNAQSGATTPKPSADKPAAAKPATQKPTTQKPTGSKPAGAKPATKKPATAKPASAALRTPAKLTETAPATFKVNFDTSVGPFVVEVTRAWAPKGADRFYNLVKHGYYNENRFFRVVPGFIVQFGLYGDPKVQAAWRDANIADDPVTQNNRRGTVVFAKTMMPNTRTTQLFINFNDNSASLDRQGFAPFGTVISGMEVVDKINAEYGQTPDQGLIQSQGNAYLNKQFPKLDYIKSATIAK
jgi:peptidyl-prolyl cis-trans isomerase A (cyclophilin A)